MLALTWKAVNKSVAEWENLTQEEQETFVQKQQQQDHDQFENEVYGGFDDVEEEVRGDIEAEEGEVGDEEVVEAEQEPEGEEDDPENPFEFQR